MRAWFRQEVLTYERRLRGDLSARVEGVDIFPTDKEVQVAITFGLGTEAEYLKGDIDNKAKTILDAMVGPVYEDDLLVRKLEIEKIRTDGQSWCLFAAKIIEPILDGNETVITE